MPHFPVSSLRNKALSNKALDVRFKACREKLGFHPSLTDRYLFAEAPFMLFH